MTTAELRTLLDHCVVRRRPARFTEQAADLQSRLEEDLAFVGALQKAEAERRAQVCTGQQPSDPEWTKLVVSYYRNWEAQAIQRLRQIEKLEAKGLSIPSAAVFRRTLGDVQSTLEELSWAELGRCACAIDED